MIAPAANTGGGEKQKNIPGYEYSYMLVHTRTYEHIRVVLLGISPRSELHPPSPPPGCNADTGGFLFLSNRKGWRVSRPLQVREAAKAWTPATNGLLASAFWQVNPLTTAKHIPHKPQAVGRQKNEGAVILTSIFFFVYDFTRGIFGRSNFNSHMV